MKVQIKTTKEMACKDCGEKDKEHYALGLCRSCYFSAYQRARYAAKKKQAGGKM